MLRILNYNDNSTSVELIDGSFYGVCCVCNCNPNCIWERLLENLFVKNMELGHSEGGGNILFLANFFLKTNKFIEQRTCSSQLIRLKCSWISSLNLTKFSRTNYVVKCEVNLMYKSYF